MRGIAREYNAGFVAATAHWQTPDELAVRQNTSARAFFEREGIDYLDVDALLPHDDPSIHDDPVHFTLKGNEMMASEWAAKVIRDDLLGLNPRTGGS
jgi:hypothetical protein